MLQLTDGGTHLLTEKIEMQMPYLNIFNYVQSCTIAHKSAFQACKILFSFVSKSNQNAENRWARSEEFLIEK